MIQNKFFRTAGPCFSVKRGKNVPGFSGEDSLTQKACSSYYEEMAAPLHGLVSNCILEVVLPCCVTHMKGEQGI